MISLSKAVEDYFERNPNALDSTTLGEPTKVNHNLANRLRAAFIAGCVAGEEGFEKQLKARFEQLFLREN